MEREGLHSYSIEEFLTRIGHDAISCWENAANVKDNEMNQISKSESRWQPPVNGSLKFNVDAAVDRTGKAGIGGILRNDKGDKVLSFPNPLSVSSIHEGELKAVEAALKLFSLSPWKNQAKLWIESDSQTTIKWIKRINNRPWRLVDTIDKLWRDISSVEFEYIPRSANHEADVLAKSGIYRVSNSVLWMP